MIKISRQIGTATIDPKIEVKGTLGFSVRGANKNSSGPLQNKSVALDHRTQSERDDHQPSLPLAVRLLDEESIHTIDIKSNDPIVTFGNHQITYVKNIYGINLQDCPILTFPDGSTVIGISEVQLQQVQSYRQTRNGPAHPLYIYGNEEYDQEFYSVLVGDEEVYLMPAACEFFEDHVFWKQQGCETALGVMGDSPFDPHAGQGAAKIKGRVNLDSVSSDLSTMTSEDWDNFLEGKGNYDKLWKELPSRLQDAGLDTSRPIYLIATVGRNNVLYKYFSNNPDELESKQNVRMCLQIVDGQLIVDIVKEPHFGKTKAHLFENPNVRLSDHVLTMLAAQQFEAALMENATISNFNKSYSGVTLTDFQQRLARSPFASVLAKIQERYPKFAKANLVLKFQYQPRRTDDDNASINSVQVVPKGQKLAKGKTYVFCEFALSPSGVLVGAVTANRRQLFRPSLLQNPDCQFPDDVVADVIAEDLTARMMEGRDPNAKGWGDVPWNEYIERFANLDFLPTWIQRRLHDGQDHLLAQDFHFVVGTRGYGEIVRAVRVATDPSSLEYIPVTLAVTYGRDGNIVARIEGVSRQYEILHGLAMIRNSQIQLQAGQLECGARLKIEDAMTGDLKSKYGSTHRMPRAEVLEKFKTFNFKKAWNDLRLEHPDVKDLSLSITWGLTDDDYVSGGLPFTEMGELRYASLAYRVDLKFSDAGVEVVNCDVNGECVDFISALQANSSVRVSSYVVGKVTGQTTAHILMRMLSKAAQADLLQMINEVLESDSDSTELIYNDDGQLLIDQIVFTDCVEFLLTLYYEDSAYGLSEQSYRYRAAKQLYEWLEREGVKLPSHIKEFYQEAKDHRKPRQHYTPITWRRRDDWDDRSGMTLARSGWETFSATTQHRITGEAANVMKDPHLQSPAKTVQSPEYYYILGRVLGRVLANDQTDDDHVEDDLIAHLWHIRRVRSRIPTQIYDGIQSVTGATRHNTHASVNERIQWVDDITNASYGHVLTEESPFRLVPGGNPAAEMEAFQTQILDDHLLIEMQQVAEASFLGAEFTDAKSLTEQMTVGGFFEVMGALAACYYDQYGNGYIKSAEQKLRYLSILLGSRSTAGLSWSRGFGHGILQMAVQEVWLDLETNHPEELKRFTGNIIRFSMLDGSVIQRSLNVLLKALVRGESLDHVLGIAGEIEIVSERDGHDHDGEHQRPQEDDPQLVSEAADTEPTNSRVDLLALTRRTLEKYPQAIILPSSNDNRQALVQTVLLKRTTKITLELGDEVQIEVPIQPHPKNSSRFLPVAGPTRYVVDGIVYSGHIYLARDIVATTPAYFAVQIYEGEKRISYQLHTAVGGGIFVNTRDCHEYENGDIHKRLGEVSDRAINDFLNFLRIENTDDESFEFFKFILRKQNKFGRRRKSIEIPYSGYVLADGSRLSFALKTVANRYRFELDRRGNLQLAYQGVGQEQPEFVVHKVQQLESNENVEVIEIPGIPTAFVLDRKTGHVQPNSIKWARKVFDFKEPDLKRVRIPLKK